MCKWTWESLTVPFVPQLQTQPPILCCGKEIKGYYSPMAEQWRPGIREGKWLVALKKGQKQNPKLPTGDIHFLTQGTPTACQPLVYLITTNAEHAGGHAFLLQCKVPWGPGKAQGEGLSNLRLWDEPQCKKDVKQWWGLVKEVWRSSLHTKSLRMILKWS